MLEKAHVVKWIFFTGGSRAGGDTDPFFVDVVVVQERINVITNDCVCVCVHALNNKLLNKYTTYVSYLSQIMAGGYGSLSLYLCFSMFNESCLSRGQISRRSVPSRFRRKRRGGVAEHNHHFQRYEAVKSTDTYEIIDVSCICTYWNGCRSRCHDAAAVAAGDECIRRRCCCCRWRCLR